MLCWGLPGCGNSMSETEVRANDQNAQESVLRLLTVSSFVFYCNVNLLRTGHTLHSIPRD